MNQIHKESNFKNCASADKLSTAALPCYMCCVQWGFESTYPYYTSFIWNGALK